MNTFEKIRIALNRDFSLKEIGQGGAHLAAQLGLWLGGGRRMILFGQNGDLSRLEVRRGAAEIEKTHDIESFRDQPDAIEDCVHLARELDVVLAIPAELTLSFEVRLPQNATTHDRSLIENNFSVWTPFSSDDVYFLHRVETSGDVAIVHVEYAPRHSLDALIAQAARLGFAIDGLVFAQSSERPLFFSRSGQSRKWLLRHGKALSFLALWILVCLNLSAFLDRLSRQEDLLRQEIAKKSLDLRKSDLPGNPVLDQLRQDAVFSGQKPSSSVSDRLLLLQSALPPQAAITSVEVAGETVTISVPSAGRELVAQSFSTLEGMTLDIRPATAGNFHELVLTPRKVP
ncbi:MAG: hypothetical protein O9322_05615 [Beijerinckiaceae bacterium]|nr:hypothetical protein [Beijerinckiaceae bacterium]MCZ8298999.1 hypothetical protein [Beijerinckiaceae bacterium]